MCVQIVKMTIKKKKNYLKITKSRRKNENNSNLSLSRLAFLSINLELVNKKKTFFYTLKSNHIRSAYVIGIREEERKKTYIFGLL